MGSGRKATVLIEGKTIREISAETGIREATLRARMRPGCTIKDLVEHTADGRAYETVIIDGMTLRELSAITGISKDTLYWRYKHGRTDFEALTTGRYALRIPRK